MRPHVVVVDDEPEVLGLLCDLLRADGYRVSSYDRPSLALQSDGLPPSVFVIDLTLPEMSGIQLAGKLRRIFRQAPIIAISASHDMIAAARQSNLFHEVVKKPFDVNGLLGSVARSLARSVA